MLLTNLFVIYFNGNNPYNIADKKENLTHLRCVNYKETIMSTVKINGMKCGHCVGSVTTALSEIPGISNVSVNLENGEASYDEESPVTMEKIQEVIRGIGFEVG